MVKSRLRVISRPMEIAPQPSLFDRPTMPVPLEQVILFALGEFQARGHKLADREFALDRLRHAFDRSCEKFGMPQSSDQKLASLLGKNGAKVVEIPIYFAKRPYGLRFPPHWRPCPHCLPSD